MRALAALGVFVFHVAWRSPPIRDLALPLWAHLDVGVDVFFVLSGFLVYRAFAAAHVAGTHPPRPVSYLMRRAARVYPAYWAALLAVVVVGDASFSGPAGVLKHVTLTFTWFDDRGGEALRVAWTLVIEISFYLLVPVWAWLVRRLSVRSTNASASEIGGVLVLMAVGAAALWAVTSGGVDDPAPLRLLPALLGLGGGMLLAATSVAAGRAGFVVGTLRRLAARPGACFAAAAGLYALMVALVPVDATPPVVVEPAMRFVQGLLQAAFGLLVVLPVALRPAAGADGARAPRTFAILASRPLAAAGLVSYGVYLWHVPVLRLAAGGLQDHGLAVALLTAAAALAASLALGAASYRLVERPANALAARAARRTDRGRRRAQAGV